MGCFRTVLDFPVYFEEFDSSDEIGVRQEAFAIAQEPWYFLNIRLRSADGREEVIIGAFETGVGTIGAADNEGKETRWSSSYF